AEAAATGAALVRAVVCLPGHLLEQSPSPLSAGETRERVDPVGESAPAVLAVADSVCHRMDGTEPFSAAAGCDVWRGAAVRGDRLLHPDARPVAAARARFAAGQSDSAGAQREDLDAPVSGGD